MYEDLLEQAERMGIPVRERPLGQHACGYYCDRPRLILIDEDLPEYAKYCTLVHELVHARYRDPGCGPQYGKAERRARIQTALQTIQPLEFAAAERMYGGDSSAIAIALDRPVQVVEDYQQWLHDHGL
ncbi:ImmA/IrrE family metallo-endopeptidase [Bifidobacterium amazonense]|uniref:ImmA/IrrE family metallo-endopeptidase n=1 Tax=Bifidobacterium amazonense TaxID=2809027 RepID=A0ABS9VZK8_9BIFI|nr:ImmA/IrrE family metallo-endopeptidase [Bifidobacterium amazonense]MCH9277241.1 ImmA/IrrE family metallo-endopeptidase [Bifidobacterium amazonense]